MKKQRDNMKTTALERIAYGLGDGGSAVILMIISSYLSLYYTDAIGFAAGYAATLMLVCRIFDGISDIAVGVLIDRTNTRFGKARPWFVISILPLALSFFAVFNMPKGISDTGMKIYAVVTYFLVTVVFATINNMAYHAMLQRFSLTSEDRSAVSGVRTIIAMLAGTAAAIFIPVVLEASGGEKSQNAWTMVTLAFGGIGTLFLLITAICIKEKLKQETPDNKQESKVGMGTQLKYILKNKYFYLAAIICILFFISSNMTSINYYYARDVIGDIKYLSYSGMVTMLPLFIGIPVSIILFQKIGKKKTMMIGLAISTAASLAILINPSDMIWNIVFSTIKQFCVLPVTTAIGTLPGDITDYCQMKNGVRSEGITSCTYTIGGKLGSGLGAAIVLWMLALGNYDSAAAVQATPAINAMIATVAVIPALLYIGLFIVLIFWDLEKYQPEVQAFMAAQIKSE